MGFIGSDAYYAICATALAVLVVLLIGIQVKSRRPPRKAPPPPPPRQEPKAHKPRYAAGGDMDHINRNAQAVQFNKKNSDAPAIIGMAIIVLLIFISIPQITKEASKQLSSPQNTTTVATSVEQPTTGTLELKLISAEPSSDLTKFFVTYEYTNNSGQTVRSIAPTVNVLNTDGEIIKSKDAEKIESIAPGESREIITAIELDMTMIENASTVTVSTTYSG